MLSCLGKFQDCPSGKSWWIVVERSTKFSDCLLSDVQNGDLRYRILQHNTFLKPVRFDFVLRQKRGRSVAVSALLAVTCNLTLKRDWDRSYFP